jgi:hypothetical protein
MAPSGIFSQLQKIMFKQTLVAWGCIIAVLISGGLLALALNQKAALALQYRSETLQLRELESEILRSLSLARIAFVDAKNSDSQRYLPVLRKSTQSIEELQKRLSKWSSNQDEAYRQRLLHEVGAHLVTLEKWTRNKPTITQQRDHTAAVLTSIHEIFEVLRKAKESAAEKSTTAYRIQLALAAGLVILSLFKTFSLFRKAAKETEPLETEFNNALAELGTSTQSLTQSAQTLRETFPALEESITSSVRTNAEALAAQEAAQETLIKFARHIKESIAAVEDVSKEIHPGDSHENTNPFFLALGATSANTDILSLELQRALEKPLSLVRYNLQALSEMVNQQAEAATNKQEEQESPQASHAPLKKNAEIFHQLLTDLQHKSEVNAKVIQKSMRQLAGGTIHD